MILFNGVGAGKGLKSKAIREKRQIIKSGLQKAKTPQHG